MVPVPIKLYANDFVLTVEFADGQIRQVEVKTFLGDSPKANEVKTSSVMFKTAHIEDEIAITWKNGFSLDPDVVYEDGTIVNALPATGSFSSKIETFYTTVYDPETI